MERLAFRGILLAGILLLTGAAGGAKATQGGSPDRNNAQALFRQAAAERLRQEFSDGGISYLLFDAQSGELLPSRWEDAERPIPLGSLIKPFTALAYAGRHAYRYPSYVCRGAASGCWQPKPHGKLDIVAAIAVSCNSYFRSLAANISGEQMRKTAAQFGLDLPDAETSGPALMGLGEEWPIAPMRMARAYLELVRRSAQPGVAPLLSGMLQAGKSGTGKAVGEALRHSDALLKTGTAPCRHEKRAPGDGFVIALLPAENPQILLMIRVHGVPGALAASTAARMLARLEQ